MAQGSNRVRRGKSSRHCRVAPYSLRPCKQDVSGDFFPTKCSKCLDHGDWEDVTCSVCMECPHNAVLLLCSSHDKGCRPYMCGTNFRFSNCLDQYKKAYTKEISPGGTFNNPIMITESGFALEKCEIKELSCPLCRGQVKGWTVVEPARDYLNSKKRNCMQDDCTFVGTYKELRKHMRAAHPSARPREIDPALEQKWRRLEREREHEDVISTIRSTMPGAMVLGDYVIERNHTGSNTDEEGGPDAHVDATDGISGFDRNLVNVFLLLHAFGPSGEGLGRRFIRQGNSQTREGTVVGIDHPSSGEDDFDDLNDENEEDGGVSLVSRLRRHGRVLLGRSGRRRRRRAGNEGHS